MIRMVFMTDKARVIGASTPKGNDARFPLLSKDLPKAMQELYQAENTAVGEPSLGSMHQPRKNRYVITRNPNYQPPVGLEDTIICTNYMELAKRYEDSEDKLLIAGGLTIFKLFLPFADSLDVAESDELVPGDLIFDEWDKGEYKLDNKVTDRIEITMTGEKLLGGYVLIHTDGKNWLLIKRKTKQK